MSGTTQSSPPTPPPPPEAGLPENISAFWREAGRELVKGSINASDEVAKQLVTITGLLEGLYFHAITFSDLLDKTKHANSTLADWWGLYLLPIGLLLLSLACALLVFFPQRYGVNIASSEGSKATFEAIASRKLRFVQGSAVFLMLGILATMGAAYVYLVK